MGGRATSQGRGKAGRSQNWTEEGDPRTVSPVRGVETAAYPAAKFNGPS